MSYQTMFQTLCSEKHLLHAWKEIKSKGSAGGIDGQTTEDFEKDLVNNMLNYGYAILYSRVCQALLAAQLNPYDSVIHVRQPGKPTFSYDFIELFRTQAVDRVVISMLQKREHAETKDGLLTDETKNLLIKNLTEMFSNVCVLENILPLAKIEACVLPKHADSQIISQNQLWLIF